MARIENTVFISYRHRDRTWAMAIYQYLTSHKFDVFFDYEGIPSGDFEAVVINNIRARAHFLLILSPDVLNDINKPDDWLRREIETAIDEKRNIVPLFIEGFNFGSPGVAEKLTGKLESLQRYNGLEIPPNYFNQAMERLRTRFLSVPLEAVLHPLPGEGWKMVKEEPAAPNQAPRQSREQAQGPAAPVRKAAPSKTAPSRREAKERPSAAPVTARKIGPYEIRSEIGRGGFGTVFLGFDPTYNRELAIKVLPAEIASSDPQFTARFEREAKDIVLLQHPAIVPVYDLGQSADHQFYIAMGYMPGGNLRGRIYQKRFSPQETFQILEPIASGLDYAYRRGFVHRDLKPGNILFDAADAACISDIIDSRLFRGAGAPGNTVFGTPAYMAPEEAQGATVDGRTHIYSLGVIVFEMLAGRLPYEADTPMAVMIKHTSEPVPDIRRINPDLPDTVQAVIEKALAKKPEDRFQTAAELVDALKAMSPNDTSSGSDSEETEMGEGGSRVDDQPVYSLMTPRADILSLDINDPVEQIRTTIAQSKFLHYPVRQDSLDTILGMVSREQLVQNLGREDFSLQEQLKPASFIPETSTASRAREFFKEKQTEVLLVIDEFGSVQGLLTLSDLEETKTPVLPEETEEERAKRLQAAIEANRLTNNRSQPVFNDKAQGEDQLGIKDEVEALAQTLLLRDVEPPVAVGIMGGWGSGKSFVMHLISQYVQATRAQRVKKGWPDGDEKDPQIPAFVGHVYQIHFNAWTYAKSNLWASLMDTIFLNLNRQMQLERLLAHRTFAPEDPPPSREQIQANLLQGGDDFKKIYVDNIQIDQDEGLKPWRRNLIHWSQHLLKENLLWNVMRGQQVETLDKLKDTEEQLKQLKARREQFEKERPLNEVTAKTLDSTGRQAYLQSLKSFMLAFLSDQLSGVAKDELKKQDVTEEEVKKYLEEAKGLWGGIQTVVSAFRRSKLYLFWTLIFFVLTFALPYVWSTYTLDFVRLRVAQITSAFFTLLPVLTVLLPWVKKSIEASIEAKKILEGAYVTQQEKRADEIANSTEKPLPQKISELQAEISNGSLAAYDALIGLLETQAEEQRQQIGPSARYSNLMEFVQARLDAATYETQLGLMHQVRQDIDELTYSLADNASPDVFPRGKPRVMLYIDDLDRCPPARVVEVLEAVQLLLNTKLFIVILGLDTRYVTRALEKEYKEILQHEGDPSGLDYIEKIIQIPYRVRPIEQTGLRNYLEKQMDIEKLIEQAAQTPTPVQPTPVQSNIAAPQPGGPATEVTPPSAGPEPGAPVSDSRKADPQKPEPVPAPKAEEVQPLEIDLPAAVIQFKQEDLDDLTTCCQRIALTPRSIKRLVNVFKLMKIFWFRADKNAGLAERDRPRSVKQAVMCLLALSSAYPEVMREVFVHLETLYRQELGQTELFTALNNIKLPPGSAHELAWQLQKYKGDLTVLKAITGNGQDRFAQILLQDFNLSSFNLVRSFSFIGDPVYWIDDDGEEEGTTKLSGRNAEKAPSRSKRMKSQPAETG